MADAAITKVLGSRAPENALKNALENTHEYALERGSSMIRRLADAGLPYVRATAEIAAEALWPTRCALCDAPGATLCAACERALPYLDQNRACPKCGAAFGSAQCSECNPVMLSAANREELPYEQAASALSFDASAKRVVSAYKDHGERRLARDMAAIMARCVPPSWVSAGCAVTFVPASSAAFRKRGFDHVELLSSEVARLCGLPHESLFARPRSFDQRDLSRSQRQANMRGRLQLLKGSVAPPSVIVVDDVCTTGATLFAACDALAEGGSTRIFCLTFARV